MYNQVPEQIKYEIYKYSTNQSLTADEDLYKQINYDSNILNKDIFRDGNCRHDTINDTNPTRS